MSKMTLIVLAGVLLIIPAAVSASTEGMEAAVQSVVESTSPLASSTPAVLRCRIQKSAPRSNAGVSAGT